MAWVSALRGGDEVRVQFGRLDAARAESEEAMRRRREWGPGSGTMLQGSVLGIRYLSY